jgi:hypothetical protein
MPVSTEQSAGNSSRCGWHWLFVLWVPLVLLLTVSLPAVTRHRPVHLRLGPVSFYAGPIDNDVYWSGGLTVRRGSLDPSHDHLVWCGVW